MDKIKDKVRLILENQAGIGKDCKERLPIDTALTKIDALYGKEIDRLKAERDALLDKITVGGVFEALLRGKYPDGFPLLPNIGKGATFVDVYPEEYKIAFDIVKYLNH